MGSFPYHWVMRVRAVTRIFLMTTLLSGCGGRPVDTTALEEHLQQVVGRFHAGRQMADLRRTELAQLQFEREVLTRDINRAHDEVTAATAQVREFRRLHELNDQDLPIDGRVAAVGLALGDVQLGGLIFRHGVVTAWDGDLLTFKHDDGIARVQIAKTAPPIQEMMRNAKPTGPRQAPLVINPSIAEDVTTSSKSAPKSQASATAQKGTQPDTPQPAGPGGVVIEAGQPPELFCSLSPEGNSDHPPCRFH